MKNFDANSRRSYLLSDKLEADPSPEVRKDLIYIPKEGVTPPHFRKSSKPKMVEINLMGEEENCELKKKSTEKTYSDAILSGAVLKREYTIDELIKIKSLVIHDLMKIKLENDDFDFLEIALEILEGDPENGKIKKYSTDISLSRKDNLVRRIESLPNTKENVLFIQFAVEKIKLFASYR